MTDSETNQVVKVVGDLQITSPSLYKEQRGLISFMGPSNTKLGQIRSYGFGGNGALLLDASDLTQGIELRSKKHQGSSFQLGGQDGQMPLWITEDKCVARKVEIHEKQTSYKNKFSGEELLKVLKSNTTEETKLQNFIGTLMLDTFKPGESTCLGLGGNTYSGWGAWGYESPTGNISSTTNTSFFGMGRNGVFTKNLSMSVDGSVSIPTRLDAGTISATTYENLPATPAADLLPLTLDNTNHFVGINNVAPTSALDVTGDSSISGTLHANNVDITHNLHVGDATVSGTISATTYLNLPPTPPPDLQPITLDSTGGKVGINQATPLEALDVTGNIQASGSILATQVDTDDVLATNITTSTISAGTYLNLPPTPPSDLLPVTLDTTNTRVGINQTTPTRTLDVNGTTNLNGVVTIQGATVQAGNGSPEGTVSAVVGSTYMRKDGASGTTLYTKISGTGNTGWEAVGKGTGGPGTVLTFTNPTTWTSPASSAAGTGTTLITATIPSGIWRIICQWRAYKPTTGTSASNQFWFWYGNNGTAAGGVTNLYQAEGLTEPDYYQYSEQLTPSTVIQNVKYLTILDRFRSVTDGTQPDFNVIIIPNNSTKNEWKFGFKTRDTNPITAGSYKCDAGDLVVRFIKLGDV